MLFGRWFEKAKKEQQTQKPKKECSLGENHESNLCEDGGNRTKLKITLPPEKLKEVAKRIYRGKQYEESVATAHIEQVFNEVINTTFIEPKCGVTDWCKFSLYLTRFAEKYHEEPSGKYEV